ncbi:MAG: hypothetical protein JWL76_842 [Thermoleophilia bacterium]|nr:hypothetical protein [Thermoleophilia bacterium]
MTDTHVPYAEGVDETAANSLSFVSAVVVPILTTLDQPSSFTHLVNGECRSLRSYPASALSHPLSPEARPPIVHQAASTEHPRLKLRRDAPQSVGPRGRMLAGYVGGVDEGVTGSLHLFCASSAALRRA